MVNQFIFKNTLEHYNSDIYRYISVHHFISALSGSYLQFVKHFTVCRNSVNFSSPSYKMRLKIFCMELDVRVSILENIKMTR